jgi:hypothetical protein
VAADAKRAKVNTMPTLQIDVPSSSAAIRARLNHPIIDSDGHQVEMNPVFLDYLAEVGGASVAKRFKNGVAFDSFLNFEWRDLKPEERRERCAMKPVWKRRIHTTAKGSTPFCAGGHRAVFALRKVPLLTFRSLRFSRRKVF